MLVSFVTENSETLALLVIIIISDVLGVLRYAWNLIGNRCRRADTVITRDKSHGPRTSAFSYSRSG